MARRFSPRSCAIRSFLVSFVVVGLVACGSGPDPKPTDFKIQATVTGLTANNSVVLQVTDAGSPATVSKNGVAVLLYGQTGAKYHVTVTTPPSNPPETCTISHGEGTVGTSDVTDVLVTCSEKTFNISVSVSGLAGSGLAICDRQIDMSCASSVPITGDGITTIRPAVADAAPYLLTFAPDGQPINRWQTCSFASTSGNVTTAGGSVQGADITVTVTCTTNKYSIAGAIVGLAGTGLRLSLAGQDDVTPGAGETSFAFGNKVDSGSSYAISVTAYPTNPSQDCAVTSASGFVGGQDTSAVVTCNTNKYAISGTVSQLRSNLVLTLANQSDHTSQDLNLSSGTSSFQFTNKLPSGSNYLIAIKTQPASPKQLCSVTQGTGVVGSADMSVAVVCQTYHQVSGRVFGAQGLPFGVSLQSDASGVTNSTTVDASGNYVFADVLDGSYKVTPSLTNWVTSPVELGASLVWNGTDGAGLNFNAIQSSCDGKWCQMTSVPYDTSGFLSFISGSGPDNVWVGMTGIGSNSAWKDFAQWDGTSWTTRRCAVSTLSLEGFSATSATNAWTVGYGGVIVNWNGVSWAYKETTNVSAYWHGVWSKGSGDVWAVGEELGSGLGKLAHYDGSVWSWSPVSVTGSIPALNAAWSIGSEAWVVGNNGTILHWDGTSGSWGPETSGTNSHLLSVWGSSSGDVWAVGNSGTIVHRSGTTWSPTTVGTSPLRSVWGTGPSDMWAVGSGGTVLHWDGTWSPLTVTTKDVQAVWGTGPKDVWISTGNAILRWQSH
jgi:hypothetical protein